MYIDGAETRGQLYNYYGHLTRNCWKKDLKRNTRWGANHSTLDRICPGLQVRFGFHVITECRYTDHEVDHVLWEPSGGYGRDLDKIATDVGLRTKYRVKSTKQAYLQNKHRLAKFPFRDSSLISFVAYLSPVSAAAV
jgi:hypothetical protein